MIYFLFLLIKRKGNIGNGGYAITYMNIYILHEYIIIIIVYTCNFLKYNMKKKYI